MEIECRSGATHDVARSVCATWSGPHVRKTPVDLSAHVRSAIAAENHHWDVVETDQWLMATPDESQIPSQGWKLHVSATVASVRAVFDACFAVLRRERCPFKIARDARAVLTLTGAHVERNALGKIITVYPATDEASVRIGRALDVATRGLAGPRVLSDRPVTEGSLVHYRFGAFGGVYEVSLDGRVLPALLDPENRVVHDAREASFTPPSWARDPFPVGTEPQQPDRTSVLLNHRYRIEIAVRHASRGGVFRATDSHSGQSVVIKQARRHVLSDLDGTDARVRLRHEAHILRRLGDVSEVVDWIELFEVDGDLFLVEEFVAGQTLRDWLGDGVQRPEHARALSETVPVLTAIARLLVRLHSCGIVVGDLTPSNLIVTPDGTVRLIDLELALETAAGPPQVRGGTPGYLAPEQASGVVGPETDLYALGKLFLFVLTGEEASLVATPEDVDGWLRRDRRAELAPRQLWGVARSLCETEPTLRPPLARVLWTLSTSSVRGHVRPSPGDLVRSALEDGTPADDATLDREIEMLTARLLTDLRLDRLDPLATSDFGRTTLSTNVQHGSAGVLGVLARAYRCTGSGGLRGPVAEVARWTARRLHVRTASTPIGLFFGTGGTLWSLADAADVLDDRELGAEAVDAALDLPRRWPLHDVTHGLAGAGLALLRLWRSTADRRLLGAAEEIAEGLLSTVRRDTHGPFWTPAADIDSTFAGSRFTGYAHGLAGVTTFLQQLNAAAPAAEIEALSRESVDALLSQAIVDHDCARWAAAPGAPTPASISWCNGAAGVAIPLTNAVAYRTDLIPILTSVGAALMTDARHWGIAYCHGLAGTIDALTDLATVLPDAGAWKVRSRVVAAEAIRRQVLAPQVGIAPVSRSDVTDFGMGYPGLLAALLRVRYGGGRPWSLPKISAAAGSRSAA